MDWNIWLALLLLKHFWQWVFMPQYRAQQRGGNLQCFKHFILFYLPPPNTNVKNPNFLYLQIFEWTVLLDLVLLVCKHFDVTIINKHDNWWLEVSTLAEISSKTSLLTEKHHWLRPICTSRNAKKLWSHLESSTSKDNINKIAEHLGGEGVVQGVGLCKRTG